MVSRSSHKTCRFSALVSLFSLAFLMPVFALNLDDFTVFSSNNTSVRDRSVVKGGLTGSNTYIELGCDAQSVGGLSSPGNAILRDRAKVTGDVTLGGVLTRGNSTVVTGTISQHASVPVLTIPTHPVSFGGTDINVWSGQTNTLAPGAYRDVHVYSNATLKLASGNYAFRKLQFEPDAKIQVAIVYNPCNIDASDALAIADRVKIELSGTTDVFYIDMYSNQSSQLRIGCDAVVKGAVTAPNAEVSVSSRANITGAVVAKMVTIEPDATVQK